MSNIWNHVKKWTNHGIYCWVNRISREKKIVATDFTAHLSFCSGNGQKAEEAELTHSSLSATLQNLCGSREVPRLAVNEDMAFPQPSYGLSGLTPCFLHQSIWGDLFLSGMGERAKDKWEGSGLGSLRERKAKLFPLLVRLTEWTQTDKREKEPSSGMGHFPRKYSGWTGWLKKGRLS